MLPGVRRVPGGKLDWNLERKRGTPSPMRAMLETLVDNNGAGWYVS